MGTNTIQIPTSNLSSPSHVKSPNVICVEGTAYDNDGHPAVAVVAKVYTAATVPNPIPTTPQSPNVSADSIGAGGSYVMNSVPLPAASAPTNYVVITWATFSLYPYPIAASAVIFAASAPGPYTDCTYPDGFNAARRLLATATPATEMELAPVSWDSNVTGFSGTSVQMFNGQWKLNLVQTAQQTILYCNGGDGTSRPKIQLRSSQPATIGWELSFVLGEKSVQYRQSGGAAEVSNRKRFENPVAYGLGEDDSMPAMVSILPA